MPKKQGKIAFITPAANVSKEGKKPLLISKVGIEWVDTINFKDYPGCLVFQAKKIDTDNYKVDNIAQLDSINVGDEVIVTYSEDCYFTDKKPEEVKTPKNPRHIDGIVNLTLVKIELVNKNSEPQPSTNSPKPKREKPSTIPDGYKWDEKSCSLIPEETDDTPF